MQYYCITVLWQKNHGHVIFSLYSTSSYFHDWKKCIIIKNAAFIFLFFSQTYTIGDFHLGIHAKVSELIGNFFSFIIRKINSISSERFVTAISPFDFFPTRLRPHQAIMGLEISRRQCETNCFPLDRARLRAGRRLSQ